MLSVLSLLLFFIIFLVKSLNYTIFVEILIKMKKLIIPALLLFTSCDKLPQTSSVVHLGIEYHFYPKNGNDIQFVSDVYLREFWADSLNCNTTNFEGSILVEALDQEIYFNCNDNIQTLIHSDLKYLFTNLTEVVNIQGGAFSFKSTDTDMYKNTKIIVNIKEL